MKQHLLLTTVSEKYIQKALDELKIGKTTIIIAHRLSTVENANTIVVMDNGSIIESGNHKELIDKKIIIINFIILKYLNSV